MNPRAQAILDNVERALLGKTDVIKVCLAALISSGHVLIEDVPGVGKTVLARALAASIGAQFKRIQFTPDLLPGDVTGVHIFNPETRQFEFRPGPIMTQVLLADEINRATPKAQSALLESMDERRVSLDGETHYLPEPFLVLATQNPLEFEGTFPLPESQLDRFLISIGIGYPDRAHELQMLVNHEEGSPVDDLQPVQSVQDLLVLQLQRRAVRVALPVRQYILDLVTATRASAEIRLGASPRATLGLFAMSQSWALMHDREYVLPDDVKAVAPAVLRHRLAPLHHNGNGRVDVLTEALLQRVPVPGNRG